MQMGLDMNGNKVIGNRYCVGIWIVIYFLTSLFQFYDPVTWNICASSDSGSYEQLAADAATYLYNGVAVKLA